MHRYLGKGGVNGNVRIYLVKDCFEIEEQLPVDIIRRRIYLDDVQMISHCRRFGWAYLLSTGLGAALVGLVALILLWNEIMWAGLGLALIMIAFGAMFLVRVVSRLDVITIHGRRKRAELTYGMKKEDVQPMFETLVRAVQEKVAATNARIEREKVVQAPPEIPRPEWDNEPKPPPASFDDFRKSIEPQAPPAPKPAEEPPSFMPPWRKPSEPERAPDSRDAWLPPSKTEPPPNG